MDSWRYDGESHLPEAGVMQINIQVSGPNRI